MPVTRVESVMTVEPDHEFEVLEDDQTVPPRPEESIADAEGDKSGPAQRAGPAE